jgi:hypothetical protein
MKLQEPPIGIILTMPVAFFKETGHTSQTLLDQFMRVLNEDDDGLWYFLKKSLPTQDFLYVYIVWDGRVQVRANLFKLERGTTYRFCDTPGGKWRTFENKNWIILCGPVVKAPKDIAMKGFQGFRYTSTELF